ncbi:MAG: TonB-dependent receptor [Bacteroidota bacterium]
MLLCLCSVVAQQSTQSIRGVIIDKTTKIPLISASVTLLGTDPLIGTTTDEQGRFVLENVVVGRYDVSVSYIGYTTFIQNEVLVRNAEETLLEIGLTESSLGLGEVVVTSNQRQVTNEAAIVSAKSFQVEELSRVPGGLDDPARMIRKFPGVTPSPYATTNQINIRGNASRAVRWRLDDIDIYNPSHFGALGGSGGALTIFSQRLLTSTDFFSGAFPADYGNALGGVFDVRFRNGNTEKRQHSVQLSVLGIDVATEGPFNKNGNASYIANYRFSTTTLVEQFLELGLLPVFQDLSFKLHFKTKKGGSLNVFGIGGISTSSRVPVQDTARWSEPGTTNYGFITETTTGTGGASYVQPIGDKTYIKSSLIGTGIAIQFKGYYQNTDLITADTAFSSLDKDFRLSWQTYVNHKFNSRHTHRTGIVLHTLNSDVYYFQQEPDSVGSSTAPLSDTLRFGQGNSMLMQAFSRSQFYLNDRWQLNAGIHAMYLALTNQLSIEPRFGVRYQINRGSSLNFGYGLHSQMDPFFTYISRQQDEVTNEFIRKNDDLRFNKAHHLTLAYYNQLNSRWRLGVELYYQSLFDLVVSTEFPISRVGGYNRLFETMDLNNGGRGENYGLEVAIEKGFKDGYFFMSNISLFEANYSGNDGIKRPSQFNTGHIFNIVGGKEWQVGRKKGKTNLLSINLSATYSGAQRYTPLDIEKSIETNLFQPDIFNPNSAKQDQLFLVDASIIYKRNRRKSNSQLTLQVSNLLNRVPITGVFFDRLNSEQGFIYGNGLIPALSWRINF